ncbi:TIM barrel protein [Streptomyces sedi]|uniref:TIM barrel protein n=1 Tax=Streptomyces sedi TaxID=555059 RepID=A0A5C4UQP6_9ACTN|nr:TIM barrel protein [Streptomyces sedi]TNM25862.1 TIM barrel protein [Streptomyces sedi]
MTFRQSFAWWSFAEAPHPLEDLLGTAAGMGFHGVDFLPPPLWPAAKDLGLELVIIDGHDSIDVGFNDRARHAELGDQVRRALETAHRENVLHLSVQPGLTAGEGDDAAIETCAEALAPLAAEAADAGVGLLLEPLNSKVDHPGHQCSTTEWGARVIDLVGRPSLRLLHDVYHMQLMEGDLLRTVDRHIDRIGHLHTAGVPGRQELDAMQEVNWAAIARRLREHRYTGFVGHEFTPRGDVAAALRQAYALFAPATS